MKKLFLLLIVTSFFMSLQAQEQPRKVYCELVGVQKLLSAQMNVRVDFGQKSTFWSKNQDSIVDDNGNKIDFNSMIDAMNYFATLGWEFESAYVVTHGSGTSSQNVYHWLLSKYISDDEKINEGFTTKREFKNQQE